MPIPLGILAAAGVRPSAGGSYELIETVIVSGSSTSSVTFSNLNNYSSTYQHLQIRYTVKTANSGSDFMNMRFNGDSASNYAFHQLYGNGSSVASYAVTNFGAIQFAYVPGTPTTNLFSVGVIDILDPYEAKNKTVRNLMNDNGTLGISLVSGHWRNTTGVTSISFTPNSNLTAGSRFSIYGLKAS